ncbi:uncharacterized protein LOC124723133 [Schistocerca piceifrons]|uniref:uncharacterized protein LOC124723133 n=1 Tax=Schistocerca piceifrons TaxID=274613 RepID=UPI001F5FE994|nr:uncharacterized protein LOC124723133 [Schistocerca piceifrons]
MAAWQFSHGCCLHCQTPAKWCRWPVNTHDPLGWNRWQPDSRFTDPEDSVATAVARRCHHNTTGQPHPDGAFAASASSRSTNGAGPTNAAVANAFYIVVWASGGGHVPFWMSSGGHFHQCTGQIVGYDWKSHVPCSHSFQSISVSTLLPPPLFSCSIYNDSPSPWWGAM